MWSGLVRSGCSQTWTAFRPTPASGVRSLRWFPVLLVRRVTGQVANTPGAAQADVVRSVNPCTSHSPPGFVGAGQTSLARPLPPRHGGLSSVG